MFLPFHFFWSFIYFLCPRRWSFLKLHPVCLTACLCLLSCLFGEGLAERLPQPPLYLSSASVAVIRLHPHRTPLLRVFCLEWSPFQSSHAVRLCTVLRQDDNFAQSAVFPSTHWKQRPTGLWLPRLQSFRVCAVFERGKPRGGAHMLMWNWRASAAAPPSSYAWGHSVEEFIWSEVSSAVTALMGFVYVSGSSCNLPFFFKNLLFKKCS